MVCVCSSTGDVSRAERIACAAVGIRPSLGCKRVNANAVSASCCERCACTTSALHLSTQCAPQGHGEHLAPDACTAPLGGVRVVQSALTRLFTTTGFNRRKANLLLCRYG
eukprot:52354-Prorocentrum_minimum.AAC.4